MSNSDITFANLLIIFCVAFVALIVLDGVGDIVNMVSEQWSLMTTELPTEGYLE